MTSASFPSSFSTAESGRGDSPSSTSRPRLRIVASRSSTSCAECTSCGIRSIHLVVRRTGPFFLEAMTFLMSAIVVRNSFSVSARMEKEGFVDLERQLQQEAKIQHYNDASTASQHLLQLRYFSTQRVSWRMVGNPETGPSLVHFRVARHSSRGTFGISRSSLNEISGAHRSRTMCWAFTLKGAAWTPPHRP